MPACASTGNLAQSVAAHAAHAGMSAYVFIPADLEQAKVLATAVYAPNLIAVKGNYDDVNRLCAEIAGEYGWAFVNVNVRPYYAEGSKTLGFEIAEQLGWTLPDHVVAPMASGSMLVKIDKAFSELANLELVADTPYRISGAQATGCSPISTGLKDGTGFVKPVRPETIAKSLAIGNPADGYYAIDAVRRTGGWMEDVSNAEVIDGIQLLACTEGVFGETAAGVTIASLRKLVVQGRIEPGERTVAVVSGHGLKTPDALADPVGQRVGGLQPVAGDDRHGALPWFDAALHHQLAQRRDGDAGGGLAEDALRAGEQLDAVDHLGVGDVLHPPAGAAHRVDGVVAVRRVADRQRLGDRRRAHGLDEAGAVLEARGDRRAAGRLCAGDAVGGVGDQLQVGELGEGLVDLDQHGAGGHGGDDVVGQRPSELLGDLEAQRLGALGVVGAHVDVDVVALDRDEVGRIDRGGKHLGLLQVGGDEHVGGHAGVRRMGGHGLGEVARRCARRRVEAQLTRGRQRHRHHPVLEGVGGVDRVVLDPQAVSYTHLT